MYMNMNMNKVIYFISILSLLITNITHADKPDGAVYLQGNNNTALILAHGKGKYPTWLVVEPLRKAVNTQLGYHTLSLQMPTGHDFWQDYANDFPDAYIRIDKAINFLRNEKGIKKIFLMGHSMGSRMVSAYVSQSPNNTLAGLIVVGCRNNGARPLSCDDNLKKKNTSIPVLDIWGNASHKDYNAATDRHHLISNNYQQIGIDHTGHRFDGYELEFTTAVVDWLRRKQ